VASLILGLLSFGCTWATGLPALLCGFRGLRDIRLSGGQLGGRWLAVGGIVGGLVGSVISLCCGGGVLLLPQWAAGRVQAAIQDQPLVREHIGDIERITFDWEDTLDSSTADEPVCIFRIDGSRGDGILAIRIPKGNFEAESFPATMELDNGRAFDLWVTQP
jgi:hypothetical protein